MSLRTIEESDMPLSRRRSRPRVAEKGIAAPVVRLWLLRMLVTLDGLRQGMASHGLRLDGLHESLGLPLQRDDDEPDLKALKSRLRELHRVAESQAHRVELPQPAGRNVARLAELVGLSSAEVLLLAFAVVLHTHAVLDAAAESLGRLSTTKACHVLSVILGLPLDEVQACLSSQGTLARSGLLHLDRNPGCSLQCKLELLSEHFADHVVSSDEEPLLLLRDVLVRSSSGHLTLSDFGHLRAALDVLKPYLRRSVAEKRAGVNVLLHGSPGTGKNQLAKALAAELGCSLYEVSSEDSDGDPLEGATRLRAYRAAQSVLAQGRALILFDEVQDVFESGDSPFGFKTAAQGRKAWINRALEGNPVPALWLTNSIGGVDAAHIRRYDVVLECPVPPRAQREKIVRESGGSLLGAAATSRLAACEVLAPAVVARAAAVVRFVGADLGPLAPADAVLQLVDATLLAQGHRRAGRAEPAALADVYDPAFVRCDADLSGVARGIAEAGSARLCLHGPPGTGKTAWARWLAARLDRPLLVRRASDLFSKWLGESEKNIAAAFRQASDDGAVLLIDEVDSFLRPRRVAKESWEVAQVNEMLTQMEGFDGVFIASTNVLEGLDPASLRRFDLKLKFDHLGPAQSGGLLVKLCSVLGLAAPQADVLGRVGRIEKLTPGDFATVARQHRLRAFDGAAGIVAALEREVALKLDGPGPCIGFI